MSELINVVIPPLAQSYTYLVPAELASQIDIGSKVSVPLGKRKASGFVISKLSENLNQQQHAYQLKSIDKIFGTLPCFDHEQLKFFQWVSDYYQEPLSNVIDCAIPALAPAKYKQTITLQKDPESPLRGKIQKQIYDLLKTENQALDYSLIQRKFKGSKLALKKLAELDIVKIESNEIIDHHLHKHALPAWAKNQFELNQEQLQALKQINSSIDAGTFNTFLLHGITGSGKTEVYIEAAKQALDQQYSVLIIVPEIALTPQLLDRFRASLGDNIAILHSALNRRVRWDAWRASKEQRNRLLIGARSAIFAPLPNLGLVIVDEEHDTSYKQSDGLRYNARDLAIVRAKLSDCTVVLGSATPSLESLYHANQKKYKYLNLPYKARAGAGLEMEIVDLNKVKPWEMISANVSPVLHLALKQTLERNEKSFILYNRRGFASFLQCDSCAAVIECPNCSVTLTYHQNNNCLLCHYCNLRLVPMQFCPKCTANKAKLIEPDAIKNAKTATVGKLVQRGAGTEKILEELQELFPSSKIQRLDRDTALDNDAYRSILEDVRCGETQILVGTQMIAKGHDLPNVTLVGVVDCDVGLHMPDFRAGERTFQLLTQAAGRAGRGHIHGRVILQTRVPAHPSLTKTLSKDYIGFAKYELAQRQKLNYPPFSKLLRIIALAEDKEQSLLELKKIKEYLSKLRDNKQLGLTILGPSPAPLQKIKAKWRSHLLLKSQSNSNLSHTIKLIKANIKIARNVRIAFDLDPQDML